MWQTFCDNTWTWVCWTIIHASCLMLLISATTSTTTLKREFAEKSLMIELNDCFMQQQLPQRHPNVSLLNNNSCPMLNVAYLSNNFYDDTYTWVCWKVSHDQTNDWFMQQQLPQRHPNVSLLNYNSCHMLNVAYLSNNFYDDTRTWVCWIISHDACL